MKSKKMKTRNNIFRKIVIMIYTIIIGIQFSVAQEKPATTEKMNTSIQLAYHKKADHSKWVSVKVTAKTKDNKRVPAVNAHLNFYIQNKDGQKIINKCSTNNDGKAEISLQKDLPADTGMFYTVVAKIENDDQFENSDEIIHFRDANLSIKFHEADTNRAVTATLMIIGTDGKEKPVKDIPVKFYIQRMFGNMPAAEDNSLNTEENGEASFNYPKEVSGGSSGVITVVTRIEDNEQFGTVDASANVKWGEIVPAEKNPFPRALWEPYAPPSLIMVICILFGGVWSIYMYIFYTLYRIKKEKKFSA